MKTSNVAKSALIFVCLVGFTLAKADCGDPQTQLELNECAAEEYEAADKELNAVYSSYRKSLPAESKTMLKEAQSAWIKFRDLSCAFEASGSIGGSIYHMVLSSCLAEKTRIRTEEIKKLGACEEGDLTCAPR